MAEDNGRPAEGGEQEYPLYRRTTDGRHAYRVESPTRFTEVQVVGNRRIVHHVTATAYPELLRIQEMVNGGEGRYLPMTVAEWDSEWQGAHTNK